MASLEQQIWAYKIMVEDNPDWKLAGIYIDIASGLRLQHREGYKQLLRDCNKGGINSPSRRAPGKDDI
ncbi:MAG: hypothetical protein FWC27_09810 [Firmicutes bacterium]|nr:hypothetical protein [Bacillota bacterium]